jgi:hypothetical protein
MAVEHGQAPGAAQPLDPGQDDGVLEQVGEIARVELVPVVQGLASSSRNRRAALAVRPAEAPS